MTTAKVEHEIEVRPLITFQSMDEMMAEYRKSDVFNFEAWRPENGAKFKTVGQALRWLKTLLGKPGWNEKTHWIVQPRIGKGFSLSIEIYLKP